MIYLLLFWTFFKIGLLAFGGGYAMIAPIQDAVLQYGWMDADTFSKFLGVCESTPGPIAINMATFIGSTQGGILGALTATIAVVLPAFTIIFLLCTVLKKVQEKPLVKSVLAGIRPAALGMIVVTGIWMMITCGFPIIEKATEWIDWKAIVIMAILFIIPVMYQKETGKKFSAISLIGISAVLGMGLYTW